FPVRRRSRLPADGSAARPGCTAEFLPKEDCCARRTEYSRGLAPCTSAPSRQTRVLQAQPTGDTRAAARVCRGEREPRHRSSSLLGSSMRNTIRIGAGVASLVTLALWATAGSSETTVERGQYLVDGVAACGNCHSGRNPDNSFADGMYM